MAYILRKTCNLRSQVDMLDAISRGLPILIPGRRKPLVPTVKEITLACQILIEHGAGKAPIRVIQPIQDQRSMTVVLSQPPGFDPLTPQLPAPAQETSVERINETHVVIEDQ